VFNIVNTVTSTNIDCQEGGNIYTDGNITLDGFSVAEASQASVTINTTAAGWGTVIFPFAVPSLPDGVKAYTCDEVAGTTLTLDEVDELAANSPYIIEGSWNATKEGWGTAASLNAKKEGLLNGVYTDTAAPNGSYVLADIGGKVAFYNFNDGDNPTVGANRCYLTAPSPARALYFPGNEETGIEAINALTSGEAKIFNASGAQIPALQKGMNIVKQSNGKSYKVIVK
jgi:hypothetical protein